MKERNNKLMKKLDRYIGCPLLFILGLFRNKNTFSELGKSPRIMLLKTAAIGDTILMDAVIKEIREQYPNGTITFVCSKNNAAMVKLLNNIDDVHVFNMAKPISSLLALKKITNVDVILDFAPWTRINGVISWMIEAKYKVGFKRKNMHRHYIYDKWIEHRDDQHELENYRAILMTLNISIQKYIPQIIPQRQFDVFKFIHDKYIVFHLFPGGASAFLRSWPDERWIELGERIYLQYGYIIVLTGGQEDIQHANRIVNEFNKHDVETISLAGKVSLDELNCVLRQSELLVTINTGIMHLGAAVDIPLIASHGATNYKRWGPISDKAVILQSGEKCQPCISLGFESKCQHPTCMQNITVDMVFEKIKYILS